MPESTTFQKQYDFSLVNTFSSSPYGGNPAVVLLLDGPLEDESAYLKIAQNFNQPIACFAFSADDDTKELDEGTPTFHIRWFTISSELAICGHGTIAATHTILGRPELIHSSINTLRFKTMHGYVYARRIMADNGQSRIEIELPAFDAKAVEESEFKRISAVVSKGLGRDVRVSYIGVSGSGEKGSGDYILIELDESEALVVVGASINVAAFVSIILPTLKLVRLLKYM